VKLYGERHLLNQPGFHSTAAIVAEIEDTADLAPLPDYAPAPRYTLMISDCYKVVNIEIDFSSEEERENSLNKVDLMLSALTAFRQGLVKEQDLYAQREAQIAANPS
jgi:hypothetical protein